jgi:hypothetical protein
VVSVDNRQFEEGVFFLLPNHFKYVRLAIAITSGGAANCLTELFLKTVNAHALPEDMHPMKISQYICKTCETGCAGRMESACSDHHEEEILL